MNGALALRVFRWVFIAAIAAASLETALSAEHGAVWRSIGAAEAVAALMLAARATRVLGFVALVAVFAAAGLHHVMGGDIPYALAIYAAGAWVVASA